MTTEPTHIQQARNELDNALAHGNGERAKAARKGLAAAGVREAAQTRKQAAATDDEQEARRKPPQQRHTPPQQTTEQPAKKAQGRAPTAKHQAKG